MKNNQSAFQWFGHFIAASLLALGLAGCADDGSPGAPGAPGPGVAPLATATALNIEVTGVTINSAPVVRFKVTNQDGVAVAGFGDADLRFNIAKLVPGSNGAPSKWQNYINGTSGTRPVFGSQERASTGGTLVDNKDGTFVYTFATDIANVTCPGPCTEVDGVTPLNVSYQPSLTHRVTIQQGNSAYPKFNAIYDFVPAGGAVTTRDIVKTETCNECHNQLSLHGSRIETKLCVTCHNPGTWDTTGPTPQTADFKVMIHKIHQGEELPSVKAGVPYNIGGHDYSTVIFPYSAVALGDTRACAKCHDGAKTANGDNWKTQPSKAACTACHDNVYFGTAPNPAKPYETESHIALAAAYTPPFTVGPDPTDDMCAQCHVSSNPTYPDIARVHDLPNLLKAEGLKYVFNIRSVTNTGPGLVPVIVFSVDNAAGVPYNIKSDPQFLNSSASLSVLVGWNNVDENNTGSNAHPGQPINISLLGSGAANAVDSGGNTYTVNMGGKTIPASGVSGSGRVALYGRVGVDVDGDTAINRVRVKAAYKDFGITDSPAVARRQVVDIAKCDKCHDQVSLHGDARTNEPGLCVICHNPSATDVNRRPKGVGTGGLFPNAALTIDSKTEEAIDFKRLIHGVHAAAKTDYSAAAAHGFRDKGLVVYGYSGAQDFSHVRFPGILNDCLTCHVTPTGSNPGTYELTGKWEVPTASGILGSSINTVPNPAGDYLLELADQTDDLNITPTAGVCSACHDGVVAKSHMQLNGALFTATQAEINTGITLEACAICHGPGRVADVKVVHGVK